MNSKINKGLITLLFGLLALTIINCDAVNTGNLSQTINNLTISTVQSSATVQSAVSQGQNSGVLQLSVSEFQMEHFNATKGHFIISSVEVSVDQANHHDSEVSHHGSKANHHDSDNESDDHNSVWMTVSDYGVNGKLYEIVSGDETSYPMDSYLLPVGKYSKIRITLADGQSQVLVPDENGSIWHNVKTPSAEESGLKLRGAFTIENNMMTRVDFNLELEKTGNENSRNHHDNSTKSAKHNDNDGQRDDKRSSENPDYLIKPEIRFVSATIVNLPAVSNITFSPAAGTYNADQNVAITTTTAGATVCYTTDGTMPACNAIAACTAGSTYLVPVTVTSSQVVNAIACKSGYMASAVSTSAYTIDKPPVAPGSFSGTVVNSSQIDLTWTASTDDITAQSAIVYEICQSNVSGSCSTFTPVYTTTPGAVSYSVTGLTAATTYYFVIRAKDQSGNVSLVSNEISVVTGGALEIRIKAGRW
jgi:hypothetical protein